jgi:hypothetical protein
LCLILANYEKKHAKINKTWKKSRKPPKIALYAVARGAKNGAKKREKINKAQNSRLENENRLNITKTIKFNAKLGKEPKFGLFKPNGAKFGLFQEWYSCFR